MELSELHFAHPVWLLAGLAIPLIWIAYILFYSIERPDLHLNKFVDSHLLPYLLVNKPEKKSSFWKHLLLWTALWSFLAIALAGPRWSFREMETFSKDQSLAILLDLSSSMTASDIKPSRLARAKQKIEDLINLSKGVKIGLIAFAADPHMIAPMTDDMETVRHLLPALDTDLIYIQGSKLSPALEMASTMLDTEPGTNKAVLVISDGGFEDSRAIQTAKKMADKGIVIHTMGVGTAEGAPIQDREGNVVKKHGAPVLSKLEKDRFSEISKVGNGSYLEALYSDEEAKAVLKGLETRAEAQLAAGRINRIWDERFYLMILPALPLMLWWFRRGYMFAILPLLFFPAINLQAEAADYFKNSEQRGMQALEAGDFEKAAGTFQDPYRKGVSCYKAGNFAEAEKWFRESSRPDISCCALYNLGNSLAMQFKLKEAITAYEDVLKQWPNHTKAQENLELVKKMLEKQQKEPQNSDNQEQNDGQNKENLSSGDQSKKEQQNKDENKDKNKNDSSNSKSNSGPGNKDEPKDQDPRGSENQENSHDNNKQKSEGDPKDRNEAQELGQNQGTQENRKGLEGHEQKQPIGRDTSSDRESNLQNAKAPKSQEDHDADLWLNRITNDPKTFMKNKFLIESRKNGTKEGTDPW